MDNCCETVLSVGADVPDFSMETYEPGVGLFGEVSLEAIKGEGKWTILVFYPADFTFVCPTEIIGFSEKNGEFESRNTVVLGVSIDSHFSHLAWRNTDRKQGGLGDIKYPLVADVTKKITSDYGVMHEAGIAFRGLFLIDKDGIVQHQVVNNLPLGRNIDEALRMVDALQFHENNGEVCPANWNKGSDGMKPDPQGSKTYFEKHN